MLSSNILNSKLMISASEILFYILSKHTDIKENIVAWIITEHK